ncbi:hypothetical protein N473_07495 [Pseudoalteromonas luteoviolacea CPMOR-1]|uniref:Tyr recombinase domain-containing protein n=1 Tax=Pseudoalteromonas luteoviolacea CPMOR-1 TaxID=1365248 RepID=A0A167NH36_9GAMM|nr:tyrosine-type recombinase/integrase [Pseudoalteromonas luteoviolacea]KZN68261.1 hypothetical protein N473_07495 [Pseudoalteromonas luteoviolacea CPMOR-1]
MRKTFGYHSYKQGVDIKTLRRLLNHSSVKETLEYIGITEDRVKDVHIGFEITI